MHLTKQQLKQIIKEELEQVVSEQDGELSEIFGMFKSKEDPKADPLEQLKKDVELYKETAFRLFTGRTRQKDAKDLYHLRMMLSGARKENPQLKSIFDMTPEDKEKVVLSRLDQDDKEFSKRWMGYKGSKKIYHDYAKFPGDNNAPIYSIRRT